MNILNLDDFAQKLQLESKYVLGRPSRTVYARFTNSTNGLPMHSLKLRKRFVLNLTEWRMFLRREIFQFHVEFVQNGSWIVSIFISVSPLNRPRSALSLPITNCLTFLIRMLTYKHLPTPL